MHDRPGFSKEYSFSSRWKGTSPGDCETFLGERRTLRSESSRESMKTSVTNDVTSSDMDIDDWSCVFVELRND